MTVRDCLPGCDLLPLHYGHCMEINLDAHGPDDWLVRYVDPEIEAAHQQRKHRKEVRRG